MSDIKNGWAFAEERQRVYERVWDFGPERILENPELAASFAEYHPSESKGVLFTLGEFLYESFNPCAVQLRIEVNDGVILAYHKRVNDVLEECEKLREKRGALKAGTSDLEDEVSKAS